MQEKELLQRAIDYMEEHMTDELDFQQIGKQALMSGYHFQQLFSIMSGYTLGEYIRNRRLSLAAEELLDTDRNIIDIAYEYGYNTPESFTRAFHRYYGITPSAARNRKVNLLKFEKISIQNILFSGGMEVMDDITRYGKRGYYVKENAPVYYTLDMDKTVAWFRDTLGWYGDVCGRNEDGTAIYGCVFDYPGDLIVANLTPFRGIHMFYGEPLTCVVGFINIKGIEEFHKYVTDKGYDKISEIYTQAWGARECSVTTPDGSILRFFETNE